jgi:electron transfer flavoprotein beta subunit
MRIVVCVKYVPDAQADRRFVDDLTTDRDGVDGLPPNWTSTPSRLL